MKRITLAVIAVVAGLVLAACGNDAGTNEGQSAANGNHNAADVTFAQEMIPHHRQAIEMAQMAAARASSPEVKALATRIQQAQDPEIATMTELLESWGEDVPSHEGGHGAMESGGMMSSEEMAELMAATGTGFDRLFLTMMTKHHEGAIEMARTEQAEGAFGPAKELAGKIVADQRAEIDEMRQLLAAL